MTFGIVPKVVETKSGIAMERIKDEFLSKLEKVVPLNGLQVLEIGCGDGTRSQRIAKRCRSLTGIDPDNHKIAAAWRRNISNAQFRRSGAEALTFVHDASFDIAIFT